VAVAGGLRFQQVSAGAGFSCGVTVDGAAYCWGANALGRLGSGAEPGETRAKPVHVAGKHAFRMVSAGTHHACGVTVDGVAYCWGEDPAFVGALGGEAFAANEPQPVTGDLRFTAVQSGFLYSCGLTTDGDVYCWGSNEYGALGSGSSAKSSKRPLRVSEQ
jgi:alpha-tubulin suppressor-like RCC1 family protein